MHEVGARVPCQSFRFAAVRRNDINVEVPGVLAAESDPPPVRRKVWIGGLSLETRQPARAAAGAWRDPDVVCVSKPDLRRTDSRRPQQSRLTAMTVLRLGFKLRLKKKTGAGEQTEKQKNWARPRHRGCPPKLVAEIWRKEYHNVLFAKPNDEEKDHDFP